MVNLDPELKRDIERIGQIGIVPTLLDVICNTTGMGFAAVARVTESRWITCSARDDIQFGLVPGSELSLETTICNEIKDSVQPVVINDVRLDEIFCNHHTPAIYGFRSYISYPIVLKTGEFFGTLCAIDPQPRDLSNSTVMGLFAAFSDLISFHLQQTELLEESGNEVKNLNRRLSDSQDENRQFRHVSSHTLQEPLRKLRVFSGMLLDAIKTNDINKAEGFAVRIQRGAERFSELIADISDFSGLGGEGGHFELIGLNTILDAVTTRLSVRLDAKHATIDIAELPTLSADPTKMELLFYHLFENAVKFSKPGVPLHISVTASEYAVVPGTMHLDPRKHYFQIIVSDNGLGIDGSQIERLFDMFSQLPASRVSEGMGIGLSICRKIVRNHGGHISIKSQAGAGTSVFLVLPG